ncbi:MAG: leucine-rich repeat domain-containing protein [Oscillospiraceae bacterium]|jgi:Leucine-rich repeat (LRR) protein|nr:leucine-rich repeat domain-containing protein [Oscillospiraceae bacterium]
MKRIIRLVIILLVAGLLYAAYALFGGRAVNAFTLRAAEQAREAGDAERAASLYERALGVSPRDETLRLLVCDLYREAGNFSRAEFTLTSGLRDVGPSAALYAKLSAVYVEQNKLLDAVNLLDTIRLPDARDKIGAARPAPPEFLLPAGVYRQRVEAELIAGDGCLIYVSWTGEVPSVTRDLYTGTVALGPGVTRARAVAVSAGGLVSEWAEAEYTLEQIIDPIEFTDPAVESLIRETIGKPEGLLYTSDIWDITSLVSARPANYTTLDDLLLCPKLQELSLTGNQGRCDISVLPLLEHLDTLSLTSFGIDSFDLEWIGQCISLGRLYLADNSIGSVAPLEGLERLEVLELPSNSILDVTPLARLGSLRILRLSQNAIQDVSALSALSNLTELRADENLLASLYGLERLERLEVLNVSYNARLASLEEIAGLTSLVRFAASHCQIEELPNLSRLKALEELYLANNSVSGFEGITGLPSLRVLDCAGNAVRSLEPLRGCIALETLDVSRNDISTVEPLAGLPSLHTIHIEYNTVSTMLPLKECPSLKEVFAFGNSLTDPLNAFDGTGIKIHRN